MTLAIARTVDDLRARVGGWRRAGESVALVPTMGALHRGHLSLVERGRALCHRVCVSIFVNPRQFDPGEDFETYPRGEAADIAKLAAAGVDLLYAPGAATMYPPGDATRVTVGGLSEPLCGVARPRFFTGVATVVAKLLLQVQPDVAVFGEKDYQQWLVVRRMTRDLAIPVEIVAGPTLREADGLAMSSRNAYLDAGQRRVAAMLFRVLSSLAARLTAPGADIEGELAAARRRLIEAGFDEVEYLALCDAETLAPLDAVDRPARLLAAATIGAVRLIDNLAVGGDPA